MTRLSITAVCLAASMSAADAQAAAYYLHANQSSTTWTTLTDWFDTPSGAGNTATTLSGADLYSNGFTVRTPNTASTLGDAATTLHLSSKLTVRRTSPGVSTANIVTSGTPTLAAGTSGAALNITSLANDVSTSVNGDSTSSRSFTLSLGTLSGNGNFTLGQSVRLTVNASTATGFTGNFVWSDASTLNFDTNFNSNGGLVMSGSASMTLDQSLSFASVSIGGQQLAPATYSFDALNGSFDTFFADGGTGSITVIPEPATVGLAAFSLMLAAARRTRCAKA